MKHHILFLSLTSLLMSAADDKNIVKSSHYLRIQYLQENGRQFAGGFVRGAYEAGVFAGVATLNGLHRFGALGLNGGTSAAVLLPVPHIVKCTELWSLHKDLQNNPKQEDWKGFDNRIVAEEVSSLKHRVYEIGFVTGSLATTVAAYKLFQLIPEDQREKWVIGGLTLGTIAWLTKDFGQHMRL